MCFHTLTFHTTTLICDTLNVEHADRRTKLRRIYMFTVLVVVYQFCRFSDDIPIGHLNKTCEERHFNVFFEVPSGEVIHGTGVRVNVPKVMKQHTSQQAQS